MTDNTKNKWRVNEGFDLGYLRVLRLGDALSNTEVIR